MPSAVRDILPLVAMAKREAVTSDSPTRTITVFLESFEHVDPAGPNVFRVSTEDQVFPDGFWLRIGVQDSGSGLGKNEREKLFERFARA